MTIPIIFVLDSSGSMAGDKIKSVNSAMKDIKEYFPNPDGEVSVVIGVLTFSTGCQWYTAGLVDLESYTCPKIESGGLTDLGCAIHELGLKLTRNDLLSQIHGQISKPIIIFMSDGYATDNWNEQLTIAEQNPWFQCAARISIGVGNDVDKDVLLRLSIPSNSIRWDSDWQVDASYMNVTDAPWLKSTLTSLFYYSVLDGCSQLHESSVLKSKRIISQVKPDKESDDSDDWD